MKKASGFEKFFKGKEKSGGAKKEQIRKEKRDVRKEREEEIAAHKRQKRAQFREANNGQPPKYNLEPPTSRFQKKACDQRPKPSFKVEKKTNNQEPRNKRFDKPRDFKKQGDRPFEKRERPFQSDKKRPDFKPVRNQQNNKASFSRNENRSPERGQKSFERNSSEQRPHRVHLAKPQGQNNKRPIPNGKYDRSNAKPETQNTKPLTEAMPLNKYIAHSGVCSRRDAVDLIKGGKVKVNGELILEPGHKVALSDEVKVAGKRLNPVKDFIYILLNKPKDYITTTDDPQERKTVLDLLKTAPPARIYPVGRLDRNTSGVLLLTNDGDLSQKLTHPSNEIKKVYAVTLDKPLTRAHFEAILKGVQLEDGPAGVDVLAYTDAQDHTQLGVELHSGRNRIVRRIFEHFGYDVKALDRVVFAGLTKKNVNRGKWRFLTEKEVRDLKFFKKGRG
ncbi:pseudouridine synthase [Flavisolibacter ginsenosidimutans]|uniref:Pseudouridine synthase n=1 Tax=Flavisolibacter ginsenosidimutans TaxID=661481 RepID=A0A5B8UE23_9BACT|nr:pseudouridine synthase [Flavisolibacter ginsenosidimutans]QEC54753.1 pseudouridine synthase [Flavisolibacter ginsenosidimutans]